MKEKLIKKEFPKNKPTKKGFYITDYNGNFENSVIEWHECFFINSTGGIVDDKITWFMEEYDKEVDSKEFYKQETLEEADTWGLAKKIFKEIRGHEPNIQEDRLDEGSVCLLERGIIEGAKWQAQQDKNRYSEEEVLELILNRPGPYLSDEEIKEWFQKHKKK
jgi:hypothetical protein